MNKNFKNMFWVLLANGINSLSQWILISIVIKFFGVDSAGLYSSAAALILPIVTFLGLNLRAIQLTDIEDKYRLSDCFVIRMIGALCTFLLVIVLTLWKGYGINAFLITLALLIRYISDLFSETAQSKLIKGGLFSKYCKSQIIRSTTSVFIFTLFAYWLGNLVICLTFYSLTWLAVFLFIDAKNVSLTEEFKDYKVNWRILSDLALVSLPLAFVSAVNVLYDTIPKYFIEYKVSINALGIFSATSYISLIGGLFVTAITLTFVTNLSEVFYKGNHRKFFRMVALQEFFVIVGCASLYLVLYLEGDKLLRLVYTDEFIQYLDLVLLLIIGMSLNFTSRVLGTACTSAHRNREQLIIALSCIALLSICCYILVPQYALTGAAIAIMIAYSMKNILLICVLVRLVIYGMKINTTDFKN